MCGGKPKVDTSYQDFAIEEANRARAEETARQARIARGMEEIKAIFEGGPVVREGNFGGDPGSFMVGSVANAMAQLPKDGSGKPTTDLKSMFGLDGETKTYEGMQPVLDARRAAMEGFYVPQLEKQFGGAKDDLTFALSRAGQLTSSVAGKKQGDLSEAFALERSGIESDINADVARTRSQMNQQRAALEAALRSSGDATAATNAALQSAVTFRQDSPTMNPIGNLFYGLSQGIGSVQQGFENGRIKALATPNPIGGGTGRVVRT